MHMKLLCSVGPTYYGSGGSSSGGGGSSGGSNNVAIGAGGGATGALAIIGVCAGLVCYGMFCHEDEPKVVRKRGFFRDKFYYVK